MTVETYESIPGKLDHKLLIHRLIDRMGQIASEEHFQRAILMLHGMLDPWDSTTDNEIKSKLEEADQAAKMEDEWKKTRAILEVFRLLIKKKIEIFGKPVKPTEGVIEHNLEDEFYKPIIEMIEEIEKTKRKK